MTQLSEVTQRPRRVAVGEFDGVHVGHRAVVAGNDTVLTFEPHPMAVLKPGAAPKLLTSLELKSELMAELGVEELVILPFDEGFARQSAREFIDGVLVEQLGATHVSVGTNFRFGHSAGGTTALLAADSRFQARVVPLVEVEGAIVSSSRIRRLVAEGHVCWASRFESGGRWSPAIGVGADWAFRPRTWSLTPVWPARRTAFTPAASVSAWPP